MNETITTVGTYEVTGYHAVHRCRVCRSEYGDHVTYYPLTTCCDATGKGLTDEATGDGFVGCRKCYREVDGIFGNGWYSEDEWQAAITHGEVRPVA